MDFRGRTYALPPHFNHLGGDSARAIIKFAKERPLGPNGLDWLKIHLVNLTGLKKRCSLDERLAFANETMEEILDSADNPLEVVYFKVPKFLYPPQNGVLGGYTVFSLSVLPSFRLSVHI